MRILFVDDEAAHAQVVTGLLRTVLEAEVVERHTVSEAVEALQAAPFDLVIMDVFIPLGDAPARVLGPRARRYREQAQHLGGLVLLDELDLVEPAPVILAHTACTERAVFEVMGDRVRGRIQKPAGAEVLLLAVLEALGLPVAG